MGNEIGVLRRRILGSSGGRGCRWGQDGEEGENPSLDDNQDHCSLISARGREERKGVTYTCVQQSWS